ncbi:MAG TPA: SCP2 sterol-binding domain-containing protein [Burkholderiales bacterium]
MSRPRPLDVLRLPLRLLPAGLHARALAAAANHLLRGQPLRERLDELEGRAVAIHIRDAGLTLCFAIRGRRLVPARGTGTVTIRGDLRDFGALAARAEDPDTLFFQRRLCIEGDVETGVHLKNLLDSIEYDWPAHLRAVLPPPLAHAVLALARRLCGRPSAA